jgi:surfactin synthase thioesterase subunit
MEEPFERIEDMAEFYLDALNELQPQGPYILIGYSFGGLVALEMAKCLLDEGRSVALLVPERYTPTLPLAGAAPVAYPAANEAPHFRNEETVGT